MYSEISVFVWLGMMSAFLFKHYIADFPLQNYYKILGVMLDNNKGIVYPLVVHGAIHAMFTASILFTASVFVAGQPLLFIPITLGIVDGVIHGLIDFVVLYFSRETKFTVTNMTFAKLFGLDQFLHGLTYVGIILAFASLV